MIILPLLACFIAPLLWTGILRESFNKDDVRTIETQTGRITTFKDSGDEYIYFDNSLIAQKSDTEREALNLYPLFYIYHRATGLENTDTLPKTDIVLLNSLSTGLLNNVKKLTDGKIYVHFQDRGLLPLWSMMNNETDDNMRIIALDGSYKNAVSNTSADIFLTGKQKHKPFD
jgi:hypothetical protein